MSDQPPIAITSTTSRPEEIVARSFPTTRRGYDPDAVRRFQEELAAQVRDATRRESELRQTLADAERRAASPPELDEATLSAAVGTETARVLHVAHEAAAELLAKAEARAAELTSGAENLVGERTRAVEAEIATLVAEGRASADAIVEEAKAECQSMVDEAREARRRILADLAERRRSLAIQLEQLRAGKDSLVGVVDHVGASVDALRRRLDGAEEEARQAAGDASRYTDVEVDDAGLEALVAEALAAPAAEEATPPELAGEELFDGAVDTDLFAENAAMTGEAASVGPPAEGSEPAAAVDVATPAGGIDTEAEVVVGGEEDADAESTAQHVDELFARLKAVQGEVEEVPPASEAEETASTAPTAVTTAAETAVEASEADAASTETETETGTEGETESGGDTEERALLERRNALQVTALGSLGRALKRSLRIEQNDLLDAVRQLTTRDDAEKVLPGEKLGERLAAVAVSGLGELWQAGATFARDELGVTTVPKAEPAAALAGAKVVAKRLGDEVVVSLRRRIDEGRQNEEADLPELIGLAFRAWKGAQVDAVAGDFAADAFALGTLAVAKEHRATVAWHLDDGGAECPDCDDNAIAGAQAVGEAFPTGQAHPPIHPGCRCLLVPQATK